jgi:hypothetical protein
MYFGEKAGRLGAFALLHVGGESKGEEVAAAVQLSGV